MSRALMRSDPAELRLVALPGFPQVERGADLAALTAAALERAALRLQRDDVLVFAQKVVSKAEGRQVDLAQVAPGERALGLARTVQKDARLVELILRESRRVVRAAPDVLIVEHRLGLVMANAGIDQSNVADPAGGEFALLLPQDPDASAARLRSALGVFTGCEPGVVISDSFGRPWRLGTVGVAIGCAGLPALLDLRGRADLFGRALRVTLVAHADEIAAAASLLMGQANEARPVVLVRGLAAVLGAGRTVQPAGAQRPDAPLPDAHPAEAALPEALPAAALIRPPQQDLFR
jgi:coenzyme F420-0:L-glutamate ligase / coenzyme F420-1:gamma-L-glutamate ligase